MKRITVLLLLAHAACGGDDTYTEEQTADAAPIVPIDAARIADAAPTTVPSLLGVDHDEIDSCEQGCAELGLTCSGRCDVGPGIAGYGYWSDTIAAWITDAEVPLTSCEKTIAQTHTWEGEQQVLTQVDCCCEAPPVTEVVRRGGTLESCDATCPDEGFSGCADFYAWSEGSSELGGVHMTYWRQATGTVQFHIDSCAHTPRPVITSASAIRELSEYKCACY